MNTSIADLPCSVCGAPSAGWVTSTHGDTIDGYSACAAHLAELSESESAAGQQVASPPSLSGSERSNPRSS